MNYDDSQLPTVVLASRNRKKMAEMASLLEPLGVRLISVADLDGVPEVEETGATFAENAALKASQVALASGYWTVADDSVWEIFRPIARVGIHLVPGRAPRRFSL